MHPSNMHYFPFTWPFTIGLFVILAVVLALLQLQVLRYAYERAGIGRQYVFLVLLASLFGSSVNIPVAEIPGEEVETEQVIYRWGIAYVVPAIAQGPGTIVAVNLGGAVIPTLVSLYLIFRNRLYLESMLAIGIVSLVVYRLAEPVRGVGITVPIFLPPITAALASFLLSRENAPALAYISGSMGVLVGADLFNLNVLQGLGAPVASIGGAGTFDGIFMAGVLGVLLAPAARMRRSTDEDAYRDRYVE